MILDELVSKRVDIQIFQIFIKQRQRSKNQKLSLGGVVS